MAQTNFMLLDLSRTALAFCLYPLFLLAPGFVAGWLTNVLDFRRRSAIARILLSLTLSISLTPILAYLAARAISFTAVWALYGLTWAATAVIAAQTLRRSGVAALRPTFLRDRAVRIALAIVLAWIILGAFSLTDLQIGERLYFSVTSHDYTKNISVTDAITRTGVPPINPSYRPGYGVELFYYYFWFLLCSLTDRLGGALVDTRGAVFGGTLWAGLALMAIVGLGLRFLRANGQRHIRARALTGLALLGVSGLDIIPVVLEAVMSFALGEKAIRSDPEYWNDQVSAWMGSALWVPHHIAGLIACLTGLILLRTLDFRRPLRAQWPAILLAALAFASATGLSIWVTLVFAAFLGIWLAALLLRPHNPRREARAEARAILLTGLLAAACALPFLLDLQRASQFEDQLPVIFKVRSFLPAERLLEPEGASNGLSASTHLVNLALLPINTILELGYFAVGAMIYWEERGRRHLPVRKDDRALIALFATSLLICSFFASCLRNNDLGWRGMFLAQYVLLLWAVDFTLAFFRRIDWTGASATIDLALKPRMRRTVMFLLIAGALTSAHIMIVLRAYPIISDLQFLDVPNEMFVDYHAGERTYALRSVYSALQEHLPGGAIIQHNPDTQLDRVHALYGQRQVVFSDRDLGTLYGIATGSALVSLEEMRTRTAGLGEIYTDSVPVYASISNAITNVFAAEGSRMDASALCSAYAIDALVVKDSDPVWQNPTSWIWSEPPLIASDFARAFDCAALVDF